MRVGTDDIYADLQRQLITATFQPGQKLKPADLQGAYGCSANTVRDVLLRLSTVGLVEFEMQRGFRVAEASPERRSDISRFRIMLEQEAVALSMQYGGVSWEARVSAAHHKLKHIETQIAQSGDITVFMNLWSDAEYEFHETLISACRSPLLTRTYANTYVQFRQQMVAETSHFSKAYFEAIILEHQAIVDAALARDVDACRLAIYDHHKRHVEGIAQDNSSSM